MPAKTPRRRDDQVIRLTDLDRRYFQLQKLNNPASSTSVDDVAKARELNGPVFVSRPMFNDLEDGKASVNCPPARTKKPAEQAGIEPTDQKLRVSQNDVRLSPDPKMSRQKQFRLDSADWLPVPHSKLIVGEDLVGDESIAEGDKTEPQQTQHEQNTLNTVVEVTAKTEVPSVGGPALLPESTIEGTRNRGEFAVAGVEEQATSPGDVALDLSDEDSAIQEDSTSEEVAKALIKDGPTISADSHAADLKIAPQERPKVAAAWEVDSFRWPSVTNELLLVQEQVFSVLVDSVKRSRANGNVIGMTGLHPGEGRSTLSICLARWAAKHGHSTLLIDGDLLRGSLVHLAGLDFTAGWQAVIDRPIETSELLVRSLDPPLTLMPVRPEMISSANFHPTAKRLNRLIQSLRASFDLLVVDAGVADDLSRCYLDERPEFDLSVIVRNLNASHPEELRRAQSQLVSCGLEHFVIAENFGRRMAG